MLRIANSPGRESLCGNSLEKHQVGGSEGGEDDALHGVPPVSRWQSWRIQEGYTKGVLEISEFTSWNNQIREAVTALRLKVY